MSSIETKAKLLGSLILFTRVFFKLRTGREFEISEPPGRESHIITMCRSLTQAQRGDVRRLIMNVPPRYGKTEQCIHFIAWCLARYPDSNFIYTSYSHSLAKKQTAIVRQIVSMPEYRRLFGVEIAKESSAKDNFETTAGGSVYAAGAGGTITGRGAGIQNVDRFGGCIVIDDIHKPSEVTSDTMRKSIIDWYLNTLASRVNNPSKTPVIFIGQRLHEDDLAANLLDGYDGNDWDRVVLKAIGPSGNPLNPKMHSIEELRKMQDKMPYEFSSQYQQDPQPSGGGIFKPEWFARLEEDPEMISTFITADTAETNKTHNDATVFSFWGLYKIIQDGIDTDVYGLHWIDCHECWVEPKDLKSEFLQFYSGCMRHEVKPQMAAIEKKSTGVTLVSVLQEMQGLQIMDIERTRASGSKTQRFLEVQPYIASKRISLNIYARHTGMCIDHMRKITANDSHRNDDIADTCADAIKLALIDKILVSRHTIDEPATNVVKTITSYNERVRRATMGSKRWQ